MKTMVHLLSIEILIMHQTFYNKPNRDKATSKLFEI